MVLYVSDFSLSIILLRIAHVITYVSTCFLSLFNNVLLYGFVTSYLSIQLLMDFCGVSAFWLMSIMLL